MLVLMHLLAVLLVLAVVAVLTGWAVGILLAIRRLCSFRMEAVALNALAGTAGCVLAFGWCSYLGFSVHEARWPLAGAMTFLIAAACWRHSPRLRVRKLYSGPAILCAVSATLCVGIILSPLAWCESVWPFDDTLTYCALSQWLQDHGMGMGVMSVDPDRPLTWMISEYQRNQWRMGSSFFLALVQGYSGLDALLAYPVAMAWGMLLNLCGIFLVARWTLRLNRWAAVGACFAAAAALNPLHTSIELGFQPQTFGTAYFSAAIALLSRAVRPTFWSRPNAMLLALIVSGLVSVYSEMAPILALTGVGYLGMATFIAWRKRRLAHFAIFSCWTLLGLIVLGNIEWLRAYHAIHAAVNALVGYPIPWSDHEYWGFALGQLPFNHRPKLGFKRMALIGAASVLLLFGTIRLMRDRRAAIAGIALLVLAAMVMHYRWDMLDSFRGRWSLFKIAKWSFPLLLAVQFAGLALILRRFRLRPWLYIAPGIVALAMTQTALREHIVWAGRSMRAVAESRTPLEEWRRLNAELDRLGAEHVYLLRHDRGRVPDILLPYAMPTRKFVNGWDGCDLVNARPSDPNTLQPGTLLLMPGMPPFEHGERLPANITRLDSSRLHLYHVEPATSGVNGVLEVGPGAVHCSIWSPRAGQLRISGVVLSNPAQEFGEPGASATGERTIREFFLRSLTLPARQTPAQVLLIESAKEKSQTSLSRGESFEIIVAVPAGRSFVRVRGDFAGAESNSSTFLLGSLRVDLVDEPAPSRSSGAH